MDNELFWKEPFNPNEYNELFHEYSVEPKINLKNEPKHLYDVLKNTVGELKSFSRLCILSKLKESGPKGEKMTREFIISSITSEIKDSTVVPNFFLTVLGASYIILLLESSGDRLLEFIQNVDNRMKRGVSLFELCNVLSFIEDVSK